GGSDRLDRTDRIEPAAGEVRRFAPAQVAIERVLDARRVPGGDEGARDRRAPQRVVIRRLVVREGGIDRHIELAQTLEHPPEADAPRLPLRGERRLEGVVRGVHAEAEDVELALPQPKVARDDRVDLDARDELEAGWDGTRAARGDVAITGEV